VQTTESLARQLETTPRLVDMMLADLERRGYIKQSSTCSDGCASCELATGCGEQPRQRLWSVRGNLTNS
jgi:hypothetical protein